MALWKVLALYSMTVTRKPHDELENAFFGKISGVNGLINQWHKIKSEWHHIKSELCLQFCHLPI